MRVARRAAVLTSHSLARSGLYCVSFFDELLRFNVGLPKSQLGSLEMRAGLANL